MFSKNKADTANTSSSSSSNNNNNNSLVKNNSATSASAAATSVSSANTATATANGSTLKWHLKLKECERGRKATVDAKLLAIRDHLTALMHLTTAAHQETASTHRFLLGMALAQEQMAQCYTTNNSNNSNSNASTADTNSGKGGGGENGKSGATSQTKKQPRASSSSQEEPLFPTLSLEQSNQLVEQKLQACAADIRGSLLLMDHNNKQMNSINSINSSSAMMDAKDDDDSNNNSMSSFGNHGTNTSTTTNTANTGLHHLLLTIQQQIRDLKRGQDYAEQLEELQRRIQKAWDAYLIRANVSLGLGDGAGGPVLNKAGQGNSSANNTNSNANSKMKKGNNSKEASDESPKTKEDLWLAEWYYRNLVAKQAQAWDKASPRLAKLFQSIRETECQRRIQIRNHLILFSEYQQRLFLGMEAASNIALMDYLSKDNRRDSSNHDASKAARQNAESSQTATATTKSSGFFGGIQQKLIGGQETEASAQQEENPPSAAAAAGTTSSTVATTGETSAQTEAAAAAAVRKNVEDRLQTDIHRHLEEHPILQQQSSDDQLGGALGDRDNVLGFYQDIFPPQSPLESEHVVMSTMVQKNKKFLQPGTTNVMILEGLALVVITTENIVHLFDLRENASVDETMPDSNTKQHIIRLHSSPALAYRALFEQTQRDQLTSVSSSSSSPLARSIKSRMVATATSALSASKHGGPSPTATIGTAMSEQVPESPEPCVSFPLLECSLDTMRQENSIAIVHVKSSTRLELILPSAYEQVGMINTFTRIAAVAAETSTAAEF